MDATPQVVEVDISSSQLLSLAENPVVLLSAPGSGYVIQPLRLFMHYKFGTVPYVDPTGGASSKIISGGLIQTVTQWSPLVTALADEVTSFTFSQFFVHSRVQDENKPVLFETNAGSGNDLINGDGTLVVRFYYFTQSL